MVSLKYDQTQYQDGMTKSKIKHKQQNMKKKNKEICEVHGSLNQKSMRIKKIKMAVSHNRNTQNIQINVWELSCSNDCCLRVIHSIRRCKAC